MAEVDRVVTLETGRKVNVEFAPQGRYILLVTLVFTLLAAWGPAWRRTPGAWGQWPLVYLGFVLLTAVWSLWTIHANPCLPSAMPPLRMSTCCLPSPSALQTRYHSL